MTGQLIIHDSVIELGIKKPFDFLHITDAHIDINSSSGTQYGIYYFERAMEFAEKNNLLVLCTGDNFKWYSETNYEYAINNFYGENNIIIPGNHDFCSFPNNDGLGNEDKSEIYMKKWSKCYKMNLYFDSKIVNNINFVTLQNIYYSISRKQIQLLKKEVDKGYPIILCMHIPLFSSKKASEMLDAGRPCGYMLATPEEYCVKYIKSHADEQSANEETSEAVEYIKKEFQIKAIIAGHIHEDFDGFADCGKRQITTDMLYKGVARRIKII